MKAINELSEKKILALTDQEIELMIKLKKAEEGVRFVEKPAEPEYMEVAEPSLAVYTCSLLEGTIAFSDKEELAKVMAALENCKSAVRVDYKYNATSSGVKYATKSLMRYTSSRSWDTVIKSVVYTEEDYDSVVSILASNSKLRASYDNALKEYKTAIASSAWIEKEILTRVQEVKDKYQQLDRYCHLFATEYLPLANNDTAIAMAFIDKAYSLNEEAQSYVLANYNSQRS